MESVRQCMAFWLSESDKPIEAEQHLLQAEQIVFSVMGADNDYMKRFIVIYTAYMQDGINRN